MPSCAFNADKITSIVNVRPSRRGASRPGHDKGKEISYDLEKAFAIHVADRDRLIKRLAQALRPLAVSRMPVADPRRTRIASARRSRFRAFTGCASAPALAHRQGGDQFLPVFLRCRGDCPRVKPAFPPSSASQQRTALSLKGASARTTKPVGLRIAVSCASSMPDRPAASTAARKSSSASFGVCSYQTSTGHLPGRTRAASFCPRKRTV
jgi:hypothetical protein